MFPTSTWNKRKKPPAGFPRWLRDARKARGLTQQAAGDMLGLSGRMIRAYETGKAVPPKRTRILLDRFIEESKKS